MTGQVISMHTTVNQNEYEIFGPKLANKYAPAIAKELGWGVILGRVLLAIF